MSEWLDRAKEEFAQLKQRLGDLETFMCLPAFLTLPTEDRNDLKAQRAGMVIYKVALEARLVRHDPSFYEPK